MQADVAPMGRRVPVAPRHNLITERHLCVVGGERQVAREAEKQHMTIAINVLLLLPLRLMNIQAS